MKTRPKLSVQAHQRYLCVWLHLHVCALGEVVTGRSKEAVLDRVACYLGKVKEKQTTMVKLLLLLGLVTSLNRIFKKSPDANSALIFTCKQLNSYPFCESYT